jgi:hypothetical protein
MDSLIEQAKQSRESATNAISSGESNAATDYLDLAYDHFPIKTDPDHPVSRHTYTQALAWLSAMVIFWALATVAMLKKEEWAR